MDVDENCKTMQGTNIAVDGDADHMEKVIKICGKQLGQCQAPIHAKVTVSYQYFISQLVRHIIKHLRINDFFFFHFDP